MKLVPIFVSDNLEEGVWSVQFDNESDNEFEKFFELIKDSDWLYAFFEQNEVDLDAGFFESITFREAVLKTLEERNEMLRTLFEYAKQGFNENSICLQYLFKPLYNSEFIIITHQKSKARIKKGWLRLYAIRLERNCYLVTGGAIKLTPDMKRPHLQRELRKLERAKEFLRANGINFAEDLKVYKNE